MRFAHVRGLVGRHEDGTEKANLKRKMRSLWGGLQQGSDDDSPEVLQEEGTRLRGSAEGGKAERSTCLWKSRYLPEYWMHLEVPADATLGSLDRFLRDTWLECCGHMSEFEIEGTRYPIEPMEVDDESMDAQLKDVLDAGNEVRSCVRLRQLHVPAVEGRLRGRERSEAKQDPSACQK